MAEQKTFPVFKTVELGCRRSVYRRAIVRAGVGVRDYASEGLERLATSKTRVHVDLVICSGADLGITGTSTIHSIIERAESLGLERCIAEVGPALRLSYAEQPEGECLLIAMEEFTNSVGQWEVFRIAHWRAEGLQLGSAVTMVPADMADIDEATTKFGPETRWVFVQPRR